YLYQNWQYEASVVRQYSPSGMEGFDYVGDGSPAIRYTLEYNIPYLQVGGKVKLGKQFSLLSNISYSPWVDAENVDQHMLRYKVNKGNLDGYSWMFKVEGQFDFTENWFMTASYDYKKMKVDGTMAAEFASFYEYIYGVVPNHTVWEEIESEQHAWAVNVGYLF
ncbi:MAG: omptin family outer membrane protease, partial [Proteobacteria bacterium]|nr:omptin family outer membrane protease [Pseudomonadota bacterium]